MPTPDIFIIEPTTTEQAEALKAFAKALNIKFKTSKSAKHEKEILSDLQEAVTEMNLIKQGKKKARDARELLNEI